MKLEGAVAEVQETSLSWLAGVLDQINGMDDLDVLDVIEFWSAVAQEAACVTNILVRSIPKEAATMRAENVSLPLPFTNEVETQ